MDEGFILSNKYRRAIFNELASGETNINRIAKKHRIVKTIVQRTLDEFIKNDLVEYSQGRYTFTKEGEKLSQSIGK